MRPHRVTDPTGSAPLNSSGVAAEVLNSARIEARFGSYGIDIIDAANGIRRSNLYSTSMSDGRMQKTCRTFSLVRMEDFDSELVASEHEAVMRGGSIGAIFKAHGWHISKETRYTGPLDLANGAHTIASLMQLADDAELAMHVYRLRLYKAAHTLTYATIVEVHHPDYLDLTELSHGYVANAQSAIGQHELRALIELVLREA